MKKKVLVGYLVGEEDILDDLEEFIQFDYDDAIIELPREIVLMLTTMDNAVLGVA